MSEIRVGPVWEAVGPFPSGMREHPFIASPLYTFPTVTGIEDNDIDFAQRPYNPEETWPSEYGDKGRVGWKRFKTNKDGWVEIAYPDIRWDQLRADFGWASLQYESLLRTSFTVPPSDNSSKTTIRIDVIQGIEYAFVPSSAKTTKIPIKWHAGDVYDFASSSTGRKMTKEGSVSNLSRCHHLDPGEYILLVRAAYEIRMFGDPGIGNPPTIRLKIQAEIQNEECLEIVDGLDVVPDVVDGWFMGDWISIGIRNCHSDAINIEGISIVGNQPQLTAFDIRLAQTTRIVSGQTRPVALSLKQKTRIDSACKELYVQFRYKEIGTLGQLRYPIWKIRPNHISLDTQDRFKITFASPTPTFPPTSLIKAVPALVSYAQVLSPQSPLDWDPQKPPVVLALHGAGVDAMSAFWGDGIPRLKGGWAVLPTGRTEWGEDWHGGSMLDVWAARDALHPILAKLGERCSSKTLLIGHSNGGQGAWHLAARYPDKIVGLIAAAGYLKIQDYVPYTLQQSNHYADPTLMGILHSTLTPYNNDLYASNLTNLPISAIHGDEDNNVPPRHSRAHLAAIAAWKGSEENLKLIEVEGKGHWWDEVLNSKEVIDWIENLPEKRSWVDDRKMGFTLSCANPQESNGRAGIKILELETPGKLARLEILPWDPNTTATPDWKGTNIKIFSISDDVGNTQICSPATKADSTSAPSLTNLDIRAYGPMIRILASQSLITIIPGDEDYLREAARNIAHDMFLYHRLDSQIIDAKDIGMISKDEFLGNVICLGNSHQNDMVKKLLDLKKLPIEFPSISSLTVNQKTINEKGSGIITLHPHPFSSQGLWMIIAGNDEEGFNLAARLFPIRTGVIVPDWAIVSNKMKWKGAGGLIGAGFWGDQWHYEPTMSWMDR